MPSTSRHSRHSKKQLHVALVLLCGVVLFGLSLNRGRFNLISSHEMEIALACIVGGVGGYCGLYAYKRARRAQRILVLIALALIISSFATLIFLGHIEEAPPLPPIPSE